LFLIVIAGLLFLGRLRAPLLEPEEALFAEIPRQMAERGNWLVPTHDGRSDYQKPPLLYWLIMASYAGFGVHDWAARLIPCAAGMGTVLATYWWGRKALGWRAGLAGALILCLSARFVHQARMITTDGLLCFWVVSGLALAQRAIQSGRLARGWWLLSAGACSFGVLSKGPVALALVAMPLLAYQILDRRIARPSWRSWLAYLATAVGLASPWFIVMAWRDPVYLREFVWTHHVVMRFLRPLHEEPAWYYVPVLLLGMLPWTLLLPGLIRLWIRRGKAGERLPGALAFLLAACLWCVVFFSAADCKRVGYILPAMPALALALGYTLDRLLAGEVLYRGRWDASLACWATQGVLTVTIISAALAGYAGLVRPERCFAMVVAAAAGMGWVWYRGRRQTVSVSWAMCGVSTFVVLLVAVQFLLPGYYHKFSLRSQVRSLLGASAYADVPVFCYPHHWDSINFYLGRTEVHSYSPEQRDHLLADLRRRPQTLLLVKSGPLLDDLLHALPASLEFVSTGRPGWVTAGVVQRPQSIDNAAVKLPTAASAHDP
jgi:dolichol-phosphate mannosyltransferase